MSRDATVTRIMVVEYAGSDAGYGMATARSKNWLETACIVEVKNVLRCLGRRIACRAACRANCDGRLSPADNMLSDHTHVRLREMIMKLHIISQSLVLQQHTLLEF